MIVFLGFLLGMGIGMFILGLRWTAAALGIVKRPTTAESLFVLFLSMSSVQMYIALALAGVI